MQCANFEAVDWQWQWHGSKETLLLRLAPDIQFETLYTSQQLLGIPVSGQGFSTSDAKVYSEYRDKFKSLPLNQQAQFTLAVNATVASLYLKPQATKSWVFQPSLEADISRIQVGQYVKAMAVDEGLYLVLDTDDTASTLFLMSRWHKIDENRWFERGKIIKVHNDRLRIEPYHIQEQDL